MALQQEFMKQQMQAMQEQTKKPRNGRHQAATDIASQKAKLFQANMCNAT